MKITDGIPFLCSCILIFLAVIFLLLGKFLITALLLFISSGILIAIIMSLRKICNVITISEKIKNDNV